MSGHGWVTPNPGGVVARCGGPGMCSTCAQEKAEAEGRTVAESPAQTIRRAAALMRERAGGCQARRWHWEALGEKRYPQRVSSDGNVAIIAETFIDPAHRPYEAEHIASWSPPVALAVADWLGSRARDAQDARVVQDSLDLSYCDDPPGIEWALKVARAYLGEAAS